jgi:hypothetical protein
VSAGSGPNTGLIVLTRAMAGKKTTRPADPARGDPSGVGTRLCR